MYRITDVSRRAILGQIANGKSSSGGKNKGTAARTEVIRSASRRGTGVQSEEAAGLLTSVHVSRTAFFALKRNHLVFNSRLQVAKLVSWREISLLPVFAMA